MARKQKQVGALPVRLNAKGKLEVLLVTTRQSRRWVIPKGWRSTRLSDADAAAREAQEEAGVTGRLLKKPVGSYSYFKREDDGFRPVKVTVYLLKVREQQKRWKEVDERKRRWLSISRAAELVQEPALATVIKRLKRTAMRKRSSKSKT
jgi:8-oxo-dGTP pyrophosphatase MutT (NUDIX family)